MSNIIVINKDTGEEVNSFMAFASNKGARFTTSILEMKTFLISTGLTECKFLAYLIDNCKPSDNTIYVVPEQMMDVLNITKKTYYSVVNSLLEKRVIKREGSYSRYMVNPRLCCKTSKFNFGKMILIWDAWEQIMLADNPRETLVKIKKLYNQGKEDYNE